MCRRCKTWRTERRRPSRLNRAASVSAACSALRNAPTPPPGGRGSPCRRTVYSTSMVRDHLAAYRAALAWRIRASAVAIGWSTHASSSAVQRACPVTPVVQPQLAGVLGHPVERSFLALAHLKRVDNKVLESYTATFTAVGVEVGRHGSQRATASRQDPPGKAKVPQNGLPRFIVQ